MVKLELATGRGRLVVYGWRDDLMRSAVELALTDVDSGLERRHFCGFDAWFKRSTLTGKARLRWGFKRVCGVKLPRVAEYYNHSWLIERLFEAPLPLAAGEFIERGMPTRQFLISEHVPNAITLEEFLIDRDRRDRVDVLNELSRETARMHALGFTHHDLYPRNILVRDDTLPRRLVFLDAWAGGPPPQWRGAAYDLACLCLHADSELTLLEFDDFLDRYTSERTAQARPVERDVLRERIIRARLALVSRLRKRPAEQRGRSVPGVIWP
ncbi:MAG: lipopolysaccharide kinase InaA family protein [Planctomycetota bacterium]|nr:lipopolysaccharide kinase InaA family protein [Planctomycetota bacterium]